jgi:phosphoenolpyruvate carboxykinase (ATP)
LSSWPCAGRGNLTAHGALRALTGQHTGRSAKDKFVVRDASTDRPDLVGQQQADDARSLRPLHADMMAHARSMDLFVQDLVGGADEANALNRG